MVRLDLAEGMVDVSLGVALLAVEVAPARVSVQRHGEEHAVLRSPAIGLVTSGPGGHASLPVGVLGNIVAVRPGPVACRGVIVSFISYYISSQLPTFLSLVVEAYPVVVACWQVLLHSILLLLGGQLRQVAAHHPAVLKHRGF